MEGNSIKSLENLCKIFEMRIKLDKEKKTKTPSEVIDNYEKYSKKIDSIYNKDFEKEIRGLISPEPTLEKEEERLEKLIDLLEDRLVKRRELEERFYNSTGKYIEGFQIIVSDDELEDKKNRLEIISKYLTTKKEMDEIDSSITKLKTSLIELEEEKSSYIEKNKTMEDSLYSTLMKSIKNDEYFNKITEENYNNELLSAEDKVKENEETLEVTLDSVKSLLKNGVNEEYTSYVEDAEKSFYVWKNREIILRIYELVISFEDDFEKIASKREEISDLLEERINTKKKLHIEDSDELENFEKLLSEQKGILSKEKEVLDNIVNYDSRIKFKEERLNELEEIVNSYEILTILREYGLAPSFDIEENEEKEEDVSFEEIEEPVLEDVINDYIDPYRIKDVVVAPRTLNLGLAKLKGESVRENVNRKLNPKPKESIFDDFAKEPLLEDKPLEDDITNNSVVEEENTDYQDEVVDNDIMDNNEVEDNVSDTSLEETKPLSFEEVKPAWEVPEEEVKEDTNSDVINTNNNYNFVTPMWDIPTNTDNSNVSFDTPSENVQVMGDNNIPVWDINPTNEVNETSEINKIETPNNNNLNNNNMFWTPVGDFEENNSFPNLNINNSFSNKNGVDNFGFPDIN